MIDHPRAPEERVGGLGLQGRARGPLMLWWWCIRTICWCGRERTLGPKIAAIFDYWARKTYHSCCFLLPIGRGGDLWGGGSSGGQGF